MEAGLAVVILGTGILATVQLFAECTRQNNVAGDMTTAMFLANNVQEAMTGLPFSDPSGSGAGLEEAGQPATLWDDLDDFNAYTAKPPIDAARAPLTDLANYSQVVTVTRVNPSQLSSAVAGGDAARVTVRVLYQPPGKPAGEVHRISWVRLRD
jgi:hypothetical protein